MKFRGHNTVDSGPPHDSVSDFTRELIDEIARDQYSLRAWKTLMSRSWARSLEDISESPARMRSLGLWSIIVASTGTGIILLSLWSQTPGGALQALVLWLPWYAGTVFFLLTHLGMVDTSDGLPHDSLLLPNGLSFIRLALAPLVIWPCLQLPVQPEPGLIFALFLVALSLSDLIDGWFARRQNLCTRMGRMLDPLADIALVTFMAAGLYLAGVLPGLLLLLLVARYPIALIAVLVMVFVRGPVSLQPTLIGKSTTFVTSVVLLIVACNALLAVSWPTQISIEWLFRVLYLLLGANIMYLFYRGATWPIHREKHSSNH